MLLINNKVCLKQPTLKQEQLIYDKIIMMYVKLLHNKESKEEINAGKKFSMEYMCEDTKGNKECELYFKLD